MNVPAISYSKSPFGESEGKNLLKLFLNDVGTLSGILYGNNILAILDDVHSINLGLVYESVVASELIAHGYKLFYYDNRNKGEVDYLIDDFANLSAVPIEVKFGKNYTVHSALNNSSAVRITTFKQHLFFPMNGRSVIKKRSLTCRFTL